MTVKKKLINHLYSADTLQHILLKDANRRVMLKKKTSRCSEEMTANKKVNYFSI